MVKHFFNSLLEAGGGSPDDVRANDQENDERESGEHSAEIVMMDRIIGRVIIISRVIGRVVGRVVIRGRVSAVTIGIIVLTHQRVEHEGVSHDVVGHPGRTAPIPVSALGPVVINVVRVAADNGGLRNV